MSWRVWCAAALACGASLASAQEAGGYSLRDLVRVALERNRELQSLRQRVAEHRGLLRQAGVRPAPGFEVGFGSGRPLGTAGEHSFSITYSHQIETGGKRPKRIAAAEIAVALAEAELDLRSRDLVLEIQQRFVDVAANRRKLNVLDRLTELNRESLRLTEARVKEGDVAALERDLLWVEIQRAQAQRAGFIGREQAALLDLRRLTALTSGERMQSAADVFPSETPPLADLQGTALQRRPELRIARLLEDQGAAELALVRAHSRPDLTVSAGYSRQTGTFDALGLTRGGIPVPLRDTDHVLSGAISIPLFAGRRNAGNLEAAMARWAGARLRREHLAAAIPLEVTAAHRRWEAAQRSVEVMARGVVEGSEKNLEVIRQAYNLGALRMLDVLNEQRRLTDTRLDYIEALAEAWRAMAELERAAGGALQ